MSKKILITGCSTGIGKETALHFKRQGWDVVSTVRREADAEDLRKAGITVLFCDIDYEDQVEALFADPALQNFDCAYLNSGYGYVSAVEDVKREALEQQFRTNVFGTWHCFTKVLEVFRRQGFGKVLVCSSVIGFSPLPYRGAYGASKAALEQMVNTARIEVDNPNIQMGLLNPGQILSNFRVTAGHLYEKYTKPQFDKTYHKDLYLKQEKRLASIKPNPLSRTPLETAQFIEKVFNKKRMPTNNLICPSTWGMWFMKRILPTFLFQKFVKSTYLLER